MKSSQRWRSMVRAGMISRFVRQFSRYLVSHYMANSQNDMLMWLMSGTQKWEMSIDGLARQSLLMNFGAIHTTSLASDGIPLPPMVRSSRLLHVDRRSRKYCTAFFPLPEYIEPLLQEVDAVVSEEGWTKAGIDKMHKIDSFLRETQRLDGIVLRSLGSFPSAPSMRY